MSGIVLEPFQYLLLIFITHTTFISASTQSLLSVKIVLHNRGCFQYEQTVGTAQTATRVSPM